MTERDALLDIFVSSVKKEVFHSVEHRHQIWRENPFDVDAVHEQARNQFQRMLTQATTPPGLDSGRILLLLGESGSGKTHLVRSFRNYVHVNGLGFVGYMQMTTAVCEYNRYLVTNLIDSFDQPYYESLGTTSALLRISNALAARCGDPAAIESLSENASLTSDAVIELVERAADSLIAQPRYADLDLDLVRALLFLQRQDPGLKKRVVKYLRCEDLSERDSRLLGGLSSKRGEEDAQRLVEHLGRLIWAFESRSLILCVDQFEDMYHIEDAEAMFRRVMSALCSIADRVPSSIIVIACLEDYYTALRTRLTRSMLDRIECDPPPAKLISRRSAPEVEMIIRQRLGYLYETSGVKLPDGAEQSLYPIPRAFVQCLSGLRIRSVLDECRRFRDRCIEAGRIVEPWLSSAKDTPQPSSQPTSNEQRIKAAKEKLEQEWNDYLAQTREEVPESDAELTELFAWAIQTCAEELESGLRFKVETRDQMIEVGVMLPRANGELQLVEEILIAICNKAPQGNGLRIQLEAATQRAGKRTIALIRCGDFPTNARTAVAQKLAGILSKGGRKAVVEESHWRKIAAFRRFRELHGLRPHFTSWLMEENHLSQLSPLIDVLHLDSLDRFEAKAAPRVSSPAPSSLEAQASVDPSLREPLSPPPAPARDAACFSQRDSTSVPTKESVSYAESRAIDLGTKGELITKTLSFEVEALTTHAAFLGSTGSGKTTLALNVIEQLLLQGVPAILIDRKGDLCAYAREAPWLEERAEPMLEARRRALREQLDIALFTPGHPGGRQLAISLVPRGIAGLKDLDRDQAAGYAAQALGDMLGYRHTRKDKSLRAILTQAFLLIAAHGNGDTFNLESLITFIAEEDPALVTALGRLDTRLFKDLVQDLETLKLSASDLLSSDGEELDAELLLGLGPYAREGRTRLSVINTRFLGDNAKILFWVSQLLLALSRWVTRVPSSRLQAVVLFDEADVYLPARSQPATKGPMENLLRRARSGGLGILLATQSPGDLDYKCRDNIRSWFLGRITQSVALDKMKPLFSEARVNVSARIPGQGVGEFHLLQDGNVTGFRSYRSVLEAEQVPEDEILKLAAQRKG